ncbi:hypothetical protein CBI38_21235 [Rhodococcus oxybenzonivorans]|uniref:Uncharacterized protein n=1 Tax=Rhodococcus oxybenzonivorans TaxID=1990687 RepID=A0A2S2BYX9_9NOCA|nr:hypothetical protein [Rhodococcus oxybenzonivorans]AWK73718.1 hypothetical protein CBI38_21235 [Rhodococcus oxybenzonivorans]
MTDTNEGPIVLDEGAEEFRPTGWEDYLIGFGGPTEFTKEDHKQWYDNALELEEEAEAAWREARRVRKLREDQLEEAQRKYPDQTGDHPSTVAAVTGGEGNEVYTAKRNLRHAQESEDQATEDYLKAKDRREVVQERYENYDVNKMLRHLLKALAVFAMIAALVAMGYTVTRSDSPPEPAVVEKSESKSVPKPGTNTPPAPAVPNPAPASPADSGPAPEPEPASDPGPAFDPGPVPGSEDSGQGMVGTTSDAGPAPEPSPAADPGPTPEAGPAPGSVDTDQGTVGTAPDPVTTWIPEITVPDLGDIPIADVTVPEPGVSITGEYPPLAPPGTDTYTQPHTDIGDAPASVW